MTIQRADKAGSERTVNHACWSRYLALPSGRSRCRFSMDRPVVSQMWFSSVYCLLLRRLLTKCSYMHTHMQVLIHQCTLEMDESLRGGVGICLSVG
ncbi:hypothetical protein J3F84DRAFT_389732 [Trichoderma pleuroticola]